MNLWLKLKQIAFYMKMQSLRRRKKETGDVYYFRPTLEITTRIGCSIMCKACPQPLLCKRYNSESSRDSVLLMTMETFTKCLDKLPKNCQIIFSGFSEPFLNDVCANMILYADKEGFSVDLYTTLVGMTFSDFDKIKNVRFNNFVLHIPDDLGTCNINMSADYFSLLDTVLSADKSDGSSLVTGFSCHGYPLPAVTKRLKVHGFKKFSPDFLVNRAGNLSDSHLLSRETGAPLFCVRSYFLNHFVLLPDGRVTLCCMDFGLKHILGNLLEESYENIIEGAKFKSIKRSIIKGNHHEVLCYNCTAAMSYDEAHFF